MFHCRRAATPTGDDRSQVGRAGRATAPYRGRPHRTRARSAMPSQRAHEMLPILVDHRRTTARPLTGRKPRASALRLLGGGVTGAAATRRGYGDDHRGPARPILSPCWCWAGSSTPPGSPSSRSITASVYRLRTGRLRAARLASFSARNVVSSVSASRSDSAVPVRSTRSPGRGRHTREPGTRRRARGSCRAGAVSPGRKPCPESSSWRGMWAEIKDPLEIDLRVNLW